MLGINFRVDSRFAPSQWETSLQTNAVSHWLGANLESALKFIRQSLNARPSKLNIHMMKPKIEVLLLSQRTLSLLLKWMLLPYWKQNDNKQNENSEKDSFHLLI